MSQAMLLKDEPQAPRWYQAKALDEIRGHFSQGLMRVLLHLATGGGKTYIFCSILKGVHAKGKHAIMVVRGKDLVDQASQRLFREGVPHGCIQANHWNNKPTERIQICSIDTLYRRRIVPKADMVVIDEAHLATSESFRWLVNRYPAAFFLPVSATPHVKGGLRHVADVVVYPVTALELMNEGWLSEPIYYAPSHIDLHNVSIDHKTGDYNAKQLGDAMNRSSVYGDVIEHYNRICPGASAVLFAVNIEHSNLMVERFNRAGIPAVHVEADTSRADREDALERLKSGEIKVICNVGILTTGVDIPHLQAVILARPTKSYNLFIQMVGRGTRAIPGVKNTFFVLDHANNIEEHGFIQAERECDLDGRKKKDTHVRPMQCRVCYILFDRGPKACPACGTAISDPEANAKTVTRDATEDQDAKLTQLKFGVDANPQRTAKLRKLICKAKLRGYKPGWVYHKITEEFGKAYANQVWSEIKLSIGGNQTP